MILPLCNLGHGVPLHRWVEAAGELDRQHGVVQQKLIGAAAPTETKLRERMAERGLRHDLPGRRVRHHRRQRERATLVGLSERRATKDREEREHYDPQDRRESCPGAGRLKQVTSPLTPARERRLGSH